MVSNTRLYGAAIALTSGVYSLWSASMTSRPGTSAMLMAVVGLIVIVHGVVLLTPFVDRIGGLSGPLMIVYAVVMLLNQTLLGTGMTGGGMTTGMGGSAITSGMGWDAGMTALAVLMLFSGLIMTRGGSGESPGM